MTQCPTWLTRWPQACRIVSALICLQMDGMKLGTDLGGKSTRTPSACRDVTLVYVVHEIVRDESSGVVIHDSAGAIGVNGKKPTRAFCRPRSVEMVVEINLADDADSQLTSWEEAELCPREAREYRAAAARLKYLAHDRPDILFASKECSRMMSALCNGDWTALQRVVRYSIG